MRKVTGQYAGLWKMGASRSLPIWYPLSLNCWPKGLSFGQASWQDENGTPYLRAKAGIALAGRQSTNARTSNRNMLNRIELARLPLPIKLVSFDNSIRPSSYGQIQIQIFWESLFIESNGRGARRQFSSPIQRS